MAVAAAAGPSISYWVITPEMDTDAVVHSIRHSWMLDAGAHAHFAVATGLSQSRDPSLHWLSGLNNSLVPFVAASRSDLNARLYQTVAPSMPNQSAHAYLLDQASSAGSSPQPSQQQQVRVKQQVDKAWRITRQYNSFLRHKVFEIMREMCRSVRREHAFDYAFLMDADTAVNRTNLEAFVRPLPAKDSVYTGFCKRRWSAGNKHVLRGVGGGPGILLSRPLLLRTCPALEHCAPLRTLMNKLDRAGGDLMLAKCMEFLGVRCQMGDELGHAGDLGDLFRRGPPWVYPPLPPGTILVASKGSNGAREVFRTQREARVASDRVISYHRVKPTRAGAVWRDRRCRILAEYKRRESGPANWYSRCLPHFAVLGTPKSGTTSLFNWLLQHPEIRQPQRKELHMWTPVLQPDKACLDRATCSVVASVAADLAKAGVKRGGNQTQRQEAAQPAAQPAARGGRKGRDLSSLSSASKPAGKAEKRAVLKEQPVRGPTAMGDTMPTAVASSTISGRRVLSAYLDFFPAIDPRDFTLTGEASPAYIYSASAELFFGCKLMSHVQLIVVLRDPAERTLSEYKNKRDLMIKGGANAAQWVWGHRRFGELVTALEPTARRCSYDALYEACEPCRRFLAAPTSSRAAQSAGGGGQAPPAPPRDATARAPQCAVPPVVWQSWYHLFLPRWLSHGEHLLLEFSDDLFGAAPAAMERVRGFLSLPPFAFDTTVAFNTESRRGAVIARSNASRNAQAAAAATHSHSEAGGGKLHAVERIVADTVHRTDALLRDSSWKASPHQHRRGVPAAWLERYSKLAAPLGSESSLL